MENFEASRRQNEEHLIEGGAEYREDGHLILTPEQIEAARAEMKKELTEIMNTEIPEKLHLFTNDGIEANMHFSLIIGDSFGGQNELADHVRSWVTFTSEDKSTATGDGNQREKHICTTYELLTLVEAKRKVYDLLQARSLEQTDEASEINAILPSEQIDYLADTARKHWGPSAIGSRFNRAVSDRDNPDAGVGKIKDLVTLLETAQAQRGDLKGDDRNILVEKGVSPEALLSFCRYLVVEVPGEVGIIQAKELPNDTKVQVVRRKHGAPCSLVIKGNEYPRVNFGVIIIGPNERQKDEDSEPTTKEMIWTAHPGLPIRPSEVDIWEEGSTVTVADVKEKLGEEAYLQFEGTD